MKTLSFLMFIILLVSCNKSQVKRDDLKIDVSSAMSRIGTIKASDYFRNVQHIPLETSDNCLIGRNPFVQLIQDKIIVTTSQKQCFLFDKQSGKFICEIGHVGNDPGGYSSADCWLDEDAGLIYFPGWDNHLICYDINGSYIDKIKIPSTETGMSMLIYNYLHGDTLVGFYPNLIGDTHNRLLFFDKKGELIDILPNEQSSSSFEIDGISVLKSEEAAALFTPIAAKGIMILSAKDPEISSIVFLGSANFWHVGKQTYFYEAFNDTIFHVQGTRLIPDKIFDLGEYHWPYEERFLKKQDKNIFMTQFLDSERFLLFRFITGLFSGDKRKLYNAIYDKTTENVQISKLSDGLTDDITHFLSIQPLSVSVKGEYIGIIPAEEITEWFEDNDDNIPEKVHHLAKVKEDDNPIIVIMN